MATRAYRNVDLGVTGQVVKATRGTLAGYHCINTNAAVRYLKFYDKATAPTQADTPKLVVKLRANTAEGEREDFSDPIQFANGIGVRATTGIADNDTGAPSANDVFLSAVRFK